MPPQKLTFVQLDDVNRFFEELPRELALTNGQGGMWHHEPGCEYLAANSVKVPGLPALLKAAETGSASKCIFPVPKDGKASDRDPFANFLAEIQFMIIDYLPAKDIASLRLCTRAVRQLPSILFRRLLLEEMPWMWEVKDMDVAKVDWHSFYFTVKFCRPDLKVLRNRKRVWKDVDEIVRRIEQLRSRGKIGS